MNTQTIDASSNFTSSMTTTPTMTINRTLRAYCVEMKYELLRFIRTPACVVPMLLLPVFLYVLIGLLVVGPKVMEDPKLPAFLFAAFAIFAISSPGMYGLGQAFAIERQSGVLTLKRTQPMPPASYLVAKIASSLICVTVVMSVLLWLATSFGHVTLNATQVVQLGATSLLGMAMFCAMGLFIGSLVSGTAAPGVVNLIYFPMMYLSGTFFPLPEAIAPWAMIWPSFYVDQIFFAITLKQNVISVPICIAVIVGLTVLFSGLAARRLARAN